MKRDRSEGGGRTTGSRGKFKKGSGGRVYVGVHRRKEGRRGKGRATGRERGRGGKGGVVTKVGPESVAVPNREGSWFQW